MTDSKSTRGRKKENLGLNNLSELLKVARAIFSDHAAAKSVKELARGMAPHYGSGNTQPAESTISAQVNGTKPLSRRLLCALHHAFDLPALGLTDENIWLDLKDSPAQFRDRLLAATIESPDHALRKLVPVGKPRLTFAPAAVAGVCTPGSGGFVGSPRSAVFEVGTQVHFKLSMPFAAYLTVIDHVPRPDGKPDYTLLNFALNCHGVALRGNSVVLPNTRPIPITEPVGRAATFAIMTRSPLTNLPDWAFQKVDFLEMEELRRLCLEVMALQSETERVVTVFDYEVVGK